MAGEATKLAKEGSRDTLKRDEEDFDATAMNLLNIDFRTQKAAPLTDHHQMGRIGVLMGLGKNVFKAKADEDPNEPSHKQNLNLYEKAADYCLNQTSLSFEGITSVQMILSAISQKMQLQTATGNPKADSVNRGIIQANTQSLLEQVLINFIEREHLQPAPSNKHNP